MSADIAAFLGRQEQELAFALAWHVLPLGRQDPGVLDDQRPRAAARRRSVAEQQVWLCRGVATELNDPEHGAGVSVGRWFRNVNWVAVPGYELFYEGNLKTGERLTQASFEATVRDAIAKGVYKGVEFHDYLGAGAGAGL